MHWGGSGAAVLAWRIWLVTRNWILVRFELRSSFNFLFSLCWFSYCVSVDGDWEHQVTLTNTSVKNIRPLSCFCSFVLVVCISVVLCWKGFAAVPLKCDESFRWSWPSVPNFCREGATFAITVLTEEKKQREDERCNLLWLLSKWSCKIYDSEFAPVVCGWPKFYWCWLISNFFSANIQIHAKPLVFTGPQS